MQSGRKHPVHFPPIEQPSRPIIVLVTVCTHERRRILATNEAMTLLLDSWQNATSWRVGRFVLMPDHLHLFCSPAESLPREIGQWIRYWKWTATRAWPRRTELPLWQANYWDRQLRSDEHYHERWEYVRNNPVRRGLVKEEDDWKWQGELNVLPW